MNRRRFASLLLGGLAAAGVVVAASGCGSDFLTTLNNFVFPETRPEVVRFPLTQADTGGIYGHVEDSGGASISGAVVSFGAARTFTGTEEGTVKVADAQNKPYTLPTGDFVLLGIPPNTPTTVTVSYDDVTKGFIIQVPATNDFRVAVGRNVPEPLGLREVATFSLPMILPKRNALRVSRVTPSGLTATATGSPPTVKLSYEPNGLVTFDLRNGPKAPASEVVGVDVEYLDENGASIKSVSKPLTPTIIPKGPINSPGPVVAVQADLADSSLGQATAGNVTAKVVFKIRTPGTASLGEKAAGEDDQTLTRTVPITIKR